ncbi:hypothetical protein KAR91_69850 [Candidatus Pacearchaeota archaeon]|nr:hypothetical protein [Candidatus Pacearchaeota archaeon]
MVTNILYEIQDLDMGASVESAADSIVEILEGAARERWYRDMAERAAGPRYEVEWEKDKTTVVYPETAEEHVTKAVAREREAADREFLDRMDREMAVKFGEQLFIAGRQCGKSRLMSQKVISEARYDEWKQEMNRYERELEEDEDRRKADRDKAVLKYSKKDIGRIEADLKASDNIWDEAEQRAKDLFKKRDIKKSPPLRGIKVMKSSPGECDGCICYNDGDCQFEEMGMSELGLPDCQDGWIYVGESEKPESVRTGRIIVRPDRADEYDCSDCYYMEDGVCVKTDKDVPELPDCSGGIIYVEEKIDG